MKLLFSVLLTVLTFNLIAQVKVKEGTQSMREGSFNAYTVVLDNISMEEAKDGWEKFIKEFKGKLNKDRKTKLYYTDNLQMPGISTNPVDLYATITENKQNTTVSVWFDTGVGYLSSTNMAVQSERAIELMSEFATNVYRTHAEESQKLQEDQLKKLNKELDKLEGTNKNLIDDIAKAKANILKWDKELIQNEDNIKKKGKDISAQKGVVKAAKEQTRQFN